MILKKIVIILLFLLNIFNTSSQTLKHELGVIIGSTSMQTDYGQRSNYISSIANVGFGIGATYFLSFEEQLRHWNDKSAFMQEHMRLKVEYSYMSSNLKHYGDYTRNVKMAAMQGSTKLMNIGAQLEVSIFPASNNKILEPYLSSGFYYVKYEAKLESALGDWRQDNSLLPSVYLNNGLFLGKDKTQSFSFGFGTRYSKNEKLSFILDWRWQRFLSDKIDGISPKIATNKYRDWLTFFSTGIVYKFY